MKINILVFLVFTLFLTSCVLEPPTSIINCTIVNKTDSIIYIDYEMQNELYPELDTIYPGQEFLKHKMLLGCTNHLSDSVIYHVFKKLQLKTKNRKLNMNPFLKSNWSELLEIHGDNCKNGKLYYTLKISNENLNN